MGTYEFVYSIRRRRLGHGDIARLAEVPFVITLFEILPLIMNRSSIHDIINERLQTLAFQIRANNRINLTHLNIHAEQFYLRLLNLLYDTEFENANMFKQNAQAIDLIDRKKRIIVQVSSTATRSKIEKSLTKLGELGLDGYHFRFLSIVEDPTKLKKKSYAIPDRISFDYQRDILGNADLLSQLGSLSIKRQQKVKDLVLTELKFPADQATPPSDLAKVIIALAKGDLNDADDDSYLSFGITAKMDANQLGVKGKALIQEHAVNSPQVQSIYNALDQAGTTKSRSVLNRVNHYYLDSITNPANKNADLILDEVHDAVRAQVLQSYKDETISDEQLDLAIGIVVVDAFIRCKILEKPR